MRRVGSGGAKPGSKPERDRLCRDMRARGCGIERIVEEMIRRWGFRPRQAWRHANRFSQEEAAAQYNEIARDPSARMTGKRISDYESWPSAGSRPTPRVLSVLAQVYGTAPERLIDLADREKMPPHDAAVIILDATRSPAPDKAANDSPAPLVSGRQSRTVVPAAGASPVWVRGPIREEVITTVARESSEHAGSAEQSNVGTMGLEQLRDQVVGLTRATGHDDPATVFAQILLVRNRIFDLLDGHQYPRQAADLYFLAGVTCGVLADVSDCFGFPTAALEQTRAAWAYAEIIGHDSLRVWCRIMQITLTCRDGRPQQALAIARSSQKYASNGLSRARLYTTEGMALAQLGDKDAAIRAFRLAQETRSSMDGSDELFHDVGGTFESPIAKTHIASASGYLSLGRPKEAMREAQTAIDLYLAAPRASRDYANEAQAHILLATARLQDGEPDGAHESLRSVLTLPVSRRVDWLGGAMRDLQRAVARSYMPDNAVIRSLRSDVESFLANMLPITFRSAS